MFTLYTLAARLWVVGAVPRLVAAQASNNSQPVSVYTAAAGFPSALFSAYYYGASPTQQPQPRIFDEVLNYTYPLELTDPNTIPEEAEDPIYFPQPVGQYSNGTAIVAAAQSQVLQILSSDRSNCSKCIAALEVGKYVAQRVPQMVPGLLVSLCQTTKFMSNHSCHENYDAENFGAVWTQVLALGDMGGSDGQYVCNYLSTTFCPKPFALPSNTTGYWTKPKPSDASSRVPKASGKRVKVLHMSDIHLDPRFDIGSESNCSTGMCCRVPTTANNYNASNITSPATIYGNFKCDSPYYLVASAFDSIGALTGTTKDNITDSDHFAWSIYTGDLVAHDPQNQASRNFTMYTEWSVYHIMKSYIHGGPVFVALGNHDTNPSAIDTPHSLPGPLGQQQSWNFDHVSALWRHNNWITEEAAAEARLHYGAYSINHPVYPKLRIITLNTDFWYRNNYLNYIDTTDPDVSTNLHFLARELEDAESKSERVWIVGHVLTGWDGTNPLPNGPDLFYQIIDRFSPHVVAAILFGHTHEDQFMLYYGANGTVRDAAHAQAVAWIGPSVTPLTNLNSGYRSYLVDTGDFHIYDAHTYVADVSGFDELDPDVAGPVFRHEYSTRATYLPDSWPADAPLNATYWHRVTEAMERNRTLVETFNTFQGKGSVMTPNCTSQACAEAKVCYMRSGSQALGRACPQGFGSVQSKYTGKNF